MYHCISLHPDIEYQGARQVSNRSKTGNIKIQGGKNEQTAEKTLCVLAGTMLLLGGAWAWADETPEKVTVIYGGSSWLGHYPAWVGIEKGLFQKHGLGVLFQNFYASSGRMGSLVAGDLDVASTGSISAIALMAAGSKGFMAFGTQDSYATVEGIIAREGIKNVG